MTEWRPKSFEDHLLQMFQRDLGGRLYAEVPLAGRALPQVWPDAGERRLDAVRFEAVGPDAGIVFHRDDNEGFGARIRREPAWLLEAKAELNRSVIGQVLVGADLLWKQHGVAPSRMIVVCGKVDSALQWVCERRGIEVFRYDRPPERG